MRKRITLVSTDAGPGHNVGLALGLEKHGQLTVVWENTNLHGLDFLYQARYGYRSIPNRGDHIIMVGASTFERVRSLPHKFRNIIQNYPRKTVIVTDGRYARNPQHYNHLFRNWEVLTTGCKRHFREPLPVKTYYQPFDLSHIETEKNEHLTIAHSPFVKKKFREKGTDQIVGICSELRLNLDLITGVSWASCLWRKAKAHIFVDQIDHYDRSKFKFRDPEYVWPALGKSGIEALHLGCCVITHGKGYDTDIPAPPVAWCNGNFKEVLKYYIKNEKEREEMAAEGRKWALRYASYDFAARNVLQ